MTARTARRLRSTFWITVVCVAYGTTFDVLMTIYETGAMGRPIFGASLGVGLGLSLAALEHSRFAERMARLPFTVSVLVKTMAYVLLLTAILVVFGMIFGTIAINSGSGRSLLMWPEFYLFLGTTLALYMVIIFFRQLDRLLGPGVLVRVLLGRYRRPRREHRVFLFLDLKSSTTIAERLTKEAYYSFVNDFFSDLSLPVLNAAGEIYQYVGDEVVLTWKHAAGMRDANCLQVFFAIDAVIERRSKYYLDRYGVVPEYKAGRTGLDRILENGLEINLIRFSLKKTNEKEFKKQRSELVDLYRAWLKEQFTQGKIVKKDLEYRLKRLEEKQ